jgi:hypothetical protein
MTLSAARDAKRGIDNGVIASSPKKASTAIYGGSLLNRLTADGKVQPGGDTASTTFGGVAVRDALSADTVIDIYTKGTFEFTFGAGSLTAASIGVAVFVNGEDTVDVAATTSNDVACGIIREVVSTTKCRVSIDGYVK